MGESGTHTHTHGAWDGDAVAMPPLRPSLPVPFPQLRLPTGLSGASMQHAARGERACARVHAASALATARLYIRTCVAYALSASRVYAYVVYVVTHVTFVHTTAYTCICSPLVIVAITYDASVSPVMGALAWMGVRVGSGNGR